MTTAILPPRPARSKPAPTNHDPDLCGLGDDTDCGACRAARQRDERDFLERDADANDRVQRRDIARRFAKATGITIDQLADALLPKQAEGITSIVVAVMDERGAA